MNTASSLTDLIKRNNLDEAKQRLAEGEKLPKELTDWDKSQIFDILITNKAFDIINTLVNDRTIVTDIYEYDKLEVSFFAKLFKHLGNSDDELAFLSDLLDKADHINEAIEDNTLLGLAFNNSASIETIKTLVDAGCDVNYKNNYEYNFLHKIIQEYEIKENTGIKYLEFLINEGLDPNAGNIVAETPLHIAIDKNKKQYVELLLQQGANPNQPDKNGETAFYKTLVHQVCNVETYNMLKEYAPADFDMANNEGETLLVGAVRMRKTGSESELRLLQALIEDGADLYQTSPYYDNPKSALDWVCEYPADVLDTVLQTGAVQVNRKDDEGNTLLHKVCAYDVNYDQEKARQLYRKVKLLMERGADVNAVNDLDQTPLDLASQDNLKDKTVQMLLNHKS